MTPESNGSSAPVPDTHRTAREIYDDFIPLMDSVVQATGTDGWKFEDGVAWSLEHDQVLYPGHCDGAPADAGPRHMEQQIYGPPSDDPAAARDQMRKYFESQGMAITAAFQPEPGDPPHATWTVTAETKDGVRIKYWSNSLQQSLLLGSECSSDPSMGSEVSRATP